MSDEFGFEASPFEIAPELGGFDDELGQRRTRPPRRPRPSSKPRPSARQLRPSGRRPRPVPPRRGPGRLIDRRPRVLLTDPFPLRPAGSERARWAQDCLNQALSLSLPVTGLMGPETRSALRSFQRRQGLRPSGILGPSTEDALNRACMDTHRQAAGARADQDEDELELGPLTATIRWIKPKGMKRNWFTLEEVAALEGRGVYILTGEDKSGPPARQQILKVGQTRSFASRFGPSGYTRASGLPDKAPRQGYNNVRAYLGTVSSAGVSLVDVETAIKRTLFRAGETMPLDLKPPPQKILLGPVRIDNILPAGWARRLTAAYTTTATAEKRRSSTGGRRSLTTGTPPSAPPGVTARQLRLEPSQFRKWEVSPAGDFFHGEVPIGGGRPRKHPTDCSCARCQRLHGLQRVEVPFHALEAIDRRAGLMGAAAGARVRTGRWLRRGNAIRVLGV